MLRVAHGEEAFRIYADADGNRYSGDQVTPALAVDDLTDE